MAVVLELNPIAGNLEAPTSAVPTAPAAPAAPASPPAHPLLGVVERAINAPKPDMAALTSIYLKLRAAKKDLESQAKERISPINQGMGMIESFFLAKMSELGVDSLKNENGTPYKAEAVSVTVADNSAFVDYVLQQSLAALPLTDAAKRAIVDAIVASGQFALIEARASKSAVEALLEETGELPPGLNRRVEAKVNVRAS